MGKQEAAIKNRLERTAVYINTQRWAEVQHVKAAQGNIHTVKYLPRGTTPAKRAEALKAFRHSIPMARTFFDEPTLVHYEFSVGDDPERLHALIPRQALITEDGKEFTNTACPIASLDFFHHATYLFFLSAMRFLQANKGHFLDFQREENASNIVIIRGLFSLLQEEPQPKNLDSRFLRMGNETPDTVSYWLGYDPQNVPSLDTAIGDFKKDFRKFMPVGLVQEFFAMPGESVLRVTELC